MDETEYSTHRYVEMCNTICFPKVHILEYKGISNEKGKGINEKDLLFERYAQF